MGKLLKFLGQSIEHLLKQAILDELNLIASAQNEERVLPPIKILECLLRDMLEGVVEEDEIVV